MYSRLFPSILPFISILLLFLIHFPRPFCAADNEYYQSCSKSYKCGDLSITYPFWGADRPQFCGYDGFEVNCTSDVLRINISTIIYRILSIDTTSAALMVARNDYYDSYCPQYLHNSTIDFDIFSYSSNYPNLTLFYNCNTTALPDYRYPLYCNTNGTVIFGYYTTPAADSSIALSACDYNIKVPVSETTIQAIQKQNGTTDEYLVSALKGGFGLQWAANNSYCTGCSRSGGQCGRNLTSDAFTCYCSDGSYPSMCGSSSQSSPGSSSSISTPVKIAIGISAAICGIVLVFIVIYCLKMKCISDCRVIFKEQRNGNQDIDAFLTHFGNLAQNRYKYSDVKKMTNSFRDKLGQGGYGCVYKGKLSNGHLVAVKVLSEAKGNGEEFINEVASISRTSHVNIVNLLGFCYERARRALIYEFMPNGSLDQFIFEKSLSMEKPHLKWKTLFEIAVGVARGLEYLHRGCNTRILHFDIKPHNILLDEDLCPKISDFGLAKLCQRKESIISMLGARGTIGYIAPEVFSRQFGGISYKSDVYSYGMMILEMAMGRENIKAESSESSEIYFPDWIFKHLESGLEFKLHRAMVEGEEELAKKMILVGLWCIQTRPSDRPSMTKVVEMLEGKIDLLQIPPKPFLSSPPRSPQCSFSISSSS